MKFQLDINVYLHQVSPPDDPVLAAIHNQGRQIMSALDSLKERVAAIKSASDAATELLHGLKAKLDEAIASGDPAAIQALSDELGVEADELSAAVAANTPGEATPT